MRDTLVMSSFYETDTHIGDVITLCFLVLKCLLLPIKQPKYRQPVYHWVLICQYQQFVHFWNFYFFLRIVNKCDNTENIKLIVLTFSFESKMNIFLAKYV